MKKILQLLFFITIFLTAIHGKAYSQNCTVNAGVDKVLCPGSSVIISGNIGGNFVPNTIIWTQVSGPNTATIASNTSISPTISNLIAGVYVFQIKATCQIGGDATDQCVITVKAGATPVAPAAIILGCYTPGTPISLIGTAPSGHTLSWHFESCTAPSTGTFNGISQTSCTGNNPTIAFSAPAPDWCYAGFSGSQATVSVTSTNTTTGCSETRTFNIFLTFNPGPVAASANPAVVCGITTPVTLTGSCQGSGTGLWTVVSAPLGAPAVTFTPNNSTATVQIGNLKAGNYIFRWTVTGSACSTGSADATLSVNGGTGNVTIPEVTGKKYCPGTFPSALALIGNIPAVSETCLWTQVSGAPVTILNATSEHAQATGLTEGGAPYIFRYTIFGASGPCSLSDTLIASVSKPFNFGSTGLSTCLYSNESSTGLGIGLIPFKQADSIPVSIIYESGPANNMQVSFSARMLYPNGNASGINHYSPAYSITRGGTATNIYYGTTLWPTYNQLNADISFTFSTLNNIASCSNQIPGIYTFRAVYKDQCGTFTSQPFTVTVNQVATFNAGSDQMLPCGNTTTTLAGNTVKCAVTPFWTTLKKPAAAPDPIDATNMYNANAPLNTLQNGSYIFMWHSNSVSNLCNLNSDSVRVTVSVTPPAVPLITGGGSICSNLPVTISGQLNDDAARGTWTVTSNPLGGSYTITPSVNSPVITFTPTTANTIYTLTWTVQNGCGTAAASTTITSGSTTAVIPNITNTDDCSAYTFGTLNASPAGGVWTSSNPYYTLTSPGSASTTVSPSTFNYWWNGPVTFYYTLPSACGSMKDSVSFSSDNYPSIVASSFCNIAGFPATQTITLSDLQPYGNYEIYAITGPGTATITPSTFIPTSGTYNLSMTVSKSGQYSFGLRKRAGTCVASLTLVVQFSNVAALALAGPDINLCGASNSTTLSAQPDPLGTGTGLWTLETLYSGYAPTIVNSNLPNSAISFNNGGGDALLKWKVMGENAACGTGTEDYMRIKYMPPAYAGIDNYACYYASTPDGSIAFGLNGNNPLPGFGQWTIVSQPVGSNAAFVNASQHNTTITGLIGGIYNLRWTVSNISETCISSDDVTLVVLYGCSVLPLDLISFTALANKNDIDVSWQLSADEDGAKYILERAFNADGPFTGIASFDQNKASNKQYGYTDADAGKLPVNIVYYRLKMYSKAGKLSYSKVAAVRLNKEGQVNVYPTIVNKGEPVNIVINSNGKYYYQVNMVSVSGQLVKKMEIKNTGTVQIPTANVASGTYIIQLNDGYNAYSYKVIIK